MPDFTKKPAVLTPEEFAQIGALLYGGQWQSALADALGIARRTVQYMAAGERSVHAGIASDILALLRNQNHNLAAWRAQIEARLHDAA